MLDSYAVATYVSSYITKFDCNLTTAFKKIKHQCLTNNDGKIQTIRKLGNTLLNMQQMSIRQAVHVVISLPLHSSSRKTIFINTAPDVKQIVVLKRPLLLEQEPNDSEDIVSASILDKYITRPTELENISLAQFASSYCCMHGTTTKRNRPCIIRYIHYNKEKDPENFFREKMILYVPHRDKCVFQKNKFKTWSEAFMACKEQIDDIE